MTLVSRTCQAFTDRRSGAQDSGFGIRTVPTPSPDTSEQERAEEFVRKGSAHPSHPARLC